MADRVLNRLRKWVLSPGSTAVPFFFFLSLTLIFFLVKIPIIRVPYKPPPRPEINLDYATYKGHTLPNGVSQYLGMRYAAPPLDNLRWRAPRDPSVENKTQDAGEFGPVCLGAKHYNWNGEAEDCLFVNVWAPEGANETSKLPVWLYIQGGGYNANSNANYNGSTVVEESGGNIVFVNFNYRVGIWGFLADEKVREDGDLNVGLLDQRFLFEWVQKHISKFGGDPNHVVLHGVSAGAGSAALHLTAYEGRDDNLFVGVASEAMFVPTHPRVEDLHWQFNETLARVGCHDTEKEPMECLRGKSKSRLQNVANLPQPYANQTEAPRFYWTPCVDGDLIWDYPSVMFNSGKFIKVPMLMGTSTDEGSTFAADASTPEDFTSFIQDNYPGLAANDTDALLEHYPEQPSLPQHDEWYPSASTAYGESTFICPNNHILNATAGAGLTNETWAYRYNVWDLEHEEAGIGVEHTFDRPAILGPDNVNYAAKSYYTYNAPVVPLMMNYYISFVRTLDPNLLRMEGAPEWGNWKGGERLVIELGETRMETVDEGERERCAFWEGVAGRMEH